MLTIRIDTFWSDNIDTFRSIDIGTVWHGKSQTKNQQYSQRDNFINNFLCQSFSKCSFYPNHLLHYRPNFVSLPTQPIYFRPSLYYSQKPSFFVKFKLQKAVRMNLNQKKNCKSDLITFFLLPLAMLILYLNHKSC